MDNILGYNLKKYRTEHNLSQEAFATILGISRTALRGYENGQNHPTSIILISMAKALNCSIDDLLGHNIKAPLNISSNEDFSNVKEKILYLDNLIKKTLNTYDDLTASKKRTDLKYSELNMSKKRADRMLDELTKSKKRVDKMLDELTMSNKRNDLTYAELERTINRLVKTQSLFKEITEKFISDIPDTSNNYDESITISALSKNTFKGFSVSSISTLEDKKLSIDDYVTVPLYGHTAAGMPCFANESIERTLLFNDKRLLSTHFYFATKIQGDSMNKLYNNGDILLVHSQSFAKDGDLIIACIDNEVTFKRFYCKDENIILQPESTNPNHITQVYPKDKVTINGIVLGKIEEYTFSEFYSSR
ncbi:MAG: hypothetical protein NSGCLCUN01_03174 [uncultured Clostridium sp.]